MIVSKSSSTSSQGKFLSEAPRMYSLLKQFTTAFIVGIFLFPNKCLHLSQDVFDAKIVFKCLIETSPQFKHLTLYHLPNVSI